MSCNKEKIWSGDDEEDEVTRTSKISMAPRMYMDPAKVVPK